MKGQLREVSYIRCQENWLVVFYRINAKTGRMVEKTYRIGRSRGRLLAQICDKLMEKARGRITPFVDGWSFSDYDLGQ